MLQTTRNDGAREPITRVVTAPDRFVAAVDPTFPATLAALKRAAGGLWVRGALPGARPLVAVVGARAASSRGVAMATALAREAHRLGRDVVSGGALGIDAAAHEGALAAGGATFAVLGCGVDVVYPDRHERLFAAIVAQGGLLSEYPPGTPPRPGHFPVRNRIVAGLAEVVIVVEAGGRSGALITADAARLAGRRVLAVPGSRGTDALIARGWAWPLAAAAELAEALRADAMGPLFAHGAAACPADARFAPLLEVLTSGRADAADVALRLGIPVPAALALCAEAEVEGLVARRAGGFFEVSRG